VNDIYIASLPVVLAAVSGILILVVDVMIKKSKKLIFALSLIFSLLPFLPFLIFYGFKSKAFGGQLIMDNLSYIFVALISVITFFIILISYSYNKRRLIKYNEYYVLLFFAQAGLIALVSSYNLLIIFIAFEIFSFSSYILTGIVKDRLSSEAVFKYLFTGIIASSIGLLGIALLYGASGTLFIDKMIKTGTNDIVIISGFILFLINVFFKFSLTPFHIWTPDVYEGAATPVSAYFSVAPKIAIIVLVLRFINLDIFLVLNLKTIFWLIAAITILWGNFVALKQKNLKRLMAYSAISHSGYIAMGFLLPYELAYKYLLFYGISYLFLNIIAFSFISYLTEGSSDDVEIRSIAGLSKKRPFESFVFSLALISLAGFPPTVGFFAKFYLFIALIESGYLWITLIAILGTLVSVFYYFRIIMYLCFKEGEKEFKFDILGKIVLSLNVVIVLVFSFYPELIFNFLGGW